MSARATPARAFRLRVSLREIEPEVWRVLLVSDSSTLAKLHAVIQRAMGWTNSHLYAAGSFDPEAFDLRKVNSGR